MFRVACIKVSCSKGGPCGQKVVKEDVEQKISEGGKSVHGRPFRLIERRNGLCWRPNKVVTRKNDRYLFLLYPKIERYVKQERSGRMPTRNNHLCPRDAFCTPARLHAAMGLACAHTRRSPSRKEGNEATTLHSLLLGGGSFSFRLGSKWCSQVTRAILNTSLLTCGVLSMNVPCLDRSFSLRKSAFKRIVFMVFVRMTVCVLPGLVGSVFSGFNPASESRN